MPKTEIIKIAMDSDLSEMLNALEEMENYIDSFINVKAKSMNRRQVIVVGIYRAAVEYSSGIRIMLTKKPMTKVANVLLRSLFEAHGTLEYITLRNDDIYLLKEIQKSLEGQKKSQEYIENYFNDTGTDKIGNLEINKIRSNQNKVRESIEKVEQEIIKIEPDNTKIQYKPKFYKQLIQVDELRIPKEPGKSIYYSYLILYPYLSAHTHFGMDGISNWLDVKGRTIYYNRSSETQDDVKRVVWTTLALLKDISTRVMSELEAYDEDYDNKYQAIIDKHQK